MPNDPSEIPVVAPGIAAAVNGLNPVTGPTQHRRTGRSPVSIAEVRDRAAIHDIHLAETRLVQCVGAEEGYFPGASVGMVGDVQRFVRGGGVGGEVEVSEGPRGVGGSVGHGRVEFQEGVILLRRRHEQRRPPLQFDAPGMGPPPVRPRAALGRCGAEFVLGIVRGVIVGDAVPVGQEVIAPRYQKTRAPRRPPRRFPDAYPRGGAAVRVFRPVGRGVARGVFRFVRAADRPGREGEGRAACASGDILVDGGSPHILVDSGLGLVLRLVPLSRPEDVRADAPDKADVNLVPLNAVRPHGNLSTTPSKRLPLNSRRVVKDQALIISEAQFRYSNLEVRGPRISQDRFAAPEQVPKDDGAVKGDDVAVDGIEGCFYGDGNDGDQHSRKK
mmetsp:Transcript_26921/g.79566  ORF Transcript_26921/g.79566 Transcript_26921/m.79566 type:complete len:387 (+) Transcript_26921:1158-2318(+)